MEPLNNAMGVPLNLSVISAQFDQRLAPFAGTAAFTVTCAAPCTSPTGSAALDGSKTVVSFTPATLLSPVTLSIAIFNNRSHRDRECSEVAVLAKLFAQFELHAFAGTPAVANVARVPAREAMPISQARKPDLCESPREPALQPLIQTSQQHVGSGRCIAVYGHDGIAFGNEIEGARLVESMAGDVKAVEIVARRPQTFEKIEAVVSAGDQSRDFRRPSFDSPTVRRQNRNLGSLATRDVHGVIDAFDIALREVVVTMK